MDFQGRQIRSTPSFGGEVKAAAHVVRLKKDISLQQPTSLLDVSAATGELGGLTRKDKLSDEDAQ
jgi:hypothetical protein